MIVASFTLFEPRLTHDSILKETNITCISWKEYGKKGVNSIAVDPKNTDDDRKVCLETRDALSEADVLVHHNGDSFDLPLLNSRLLKHGLKPMPPIPTVDTYKVVKQKFRFDSNKLDHVAHFLGIGTKKKTDFKLWLKILKGDPAAVKYMVKYNQHDVVLLEKIYNKLRPFMTNHPNQRLFDFGDCPICGKGPLTSQGYRYTRTTKRQRFQCKACGGWSQGAMKERTKVS